MIKTMQNGFNIEDQIKEAKRELNMRQFKYPQWVADGKMSQAKANQQIETMKAIVFTLQEVAKENSPQQGLF